MEGKKAEAFVVWDSEDEVVEKYYERDGSEAQEDRVREALSRLEEQLSPQRNVHYGRSTVATWDAERREARVVHNNNGKLIKTLGTTKQGVLYLNALETLYLVDSGQLELYHHGLPCSLQDSYRALSPVSDAFYRVYFHLKKANYIVFLKSPQSLSFGSICFEIWSPQGTKNFRKTDPGCPHYCVAVFAIDGVFPGYGVFEELRKSSGGVPVLIALENQGNITIYQLKELLQPLESHQKDWLKKPNPT
eukprot:TRINITY_DN10470_c0_g1_i1.p1 TRINITY_DN10470_c0_g1~~TRINITY_DN10470_c0_g1_i1.p1  ORF type:complete len:248 (+),score=55.92 TRINITY_DN10470_c0_g1_i1:85-828(+)